MRVPAYELAVHSGATGLVAWLKRRSATILTYHGLIDREPPPSLRAPYKVMVTVAAFREQMEILRTRYQVLPLDELVRRIARDGGERLAAVTFDDGWQSTATHAAPILRALGIPATVFLATGLMDSPQRGLWTHRLWWSLAQDEEPASTHARIRDLKSLPVGVRNARVAEILGPRAPDMPADLAFMTWKEVRALPRAGFAIGAHTVDHEILASLSPREVAGQVRRSKHDVERAIGEPCTLFAYPNGAADDFDGEHVRFLQEEGFAAAVTQIPGRNPARSDPFRLRRINVGLEHSRAAFLAELDGLRHWH